MLTQIHTVSTYIAPPSLSLLAKKVIIACVCNIEEIAVFH